ncbi:protein translocase subunit SecD [Salipiger thiooxidans]|uniref:protein translocase subunit SecD n=1 Tax=Salipiger thiooxidans TaxID=282683 RepID=UPI001CD534EA|nr:protein translocase subunit SecD [Salipiger thiooxidans]MCA0851523.1 protein translocase subunit SecD [Salipiger thiooxidans]
MQRPTLFKRLGVWGVCLLCLWLALPNAFYSRVEQHNDLTSGTATKAVVETDPKAVYWPEWLSSGLVNLGLDLRGGAHLLAEVDVDGVARERMDALWPELRDALRGEVGAIRRADAPEGELRVTLAEPQNMATALDIAHRFATPVSSLAGAGQSDITASDENGTLVLRYTEAGRAEMTDRVVAQSLEIIRRRIDEAGTREPTILRQGADRILIEVPGIDSAETLKSLIGTTARLSFNQVLGATGDGDALTLPAADRPEETYRLDPRAVVTGADLVDSQPSFDRNGRPAVTFRFDSAGARTFGDFTAAHIGEPFAIVLDGKVLSAPVIQSHIAGGSGIITGNFSVEQATELSTLLRAGALPAKLTFLEERTIGPELGQDSITAGARAAVVGLVAVCVLMVVSYGGLGLFATFALAVNMAMLLGLLSAIGATLTLPGIAGIVLTMGMAVDANVLIFERIREELRVETSVWRAVGKGFDNAFSAILDSNLTGLLTAGLMFWLGSGPVRGFAVTMGLGILTSMFTALFVTRLVLQSWLEWRQPRNLKMQGLLSRLPAQTSINFFRAQYATFGASALAVVVSVFLIATMGLNLGIDFKGGASIRAETHQSLDIGAYRSALSGIGMEDAVITEVFDPTFAADQHVVSIRIGAEDGDAALSQETLASVETALRAADPGIAFTSVETIGGKVSAELLWMALMAVGAATAGILAYVWFRFEWQFSVGAVAALIHDVVVTLGVFSLFQLKVDLTIVAALLTILGYSINDTVVVFDRVRENLRKYRQMPLRDLLNLSANETLSRTLMTSLTTLVALIALLVLGGDVIRGFVFAITFGIVIGTWSSIYVAKNIVLMLGVDRRSREEREAALAATHS